jgi:diketogulonate reductase-like aldo/keto reductase
MNDLSRRQVLQGLASACALWSTASSRAAAPSPGAGGAKRGDMLKRAIPASPAHEAVPVIGMGTWNTFDVGGSARDREPLVEVLQAFYAAGASVIDSSPMYGTAEAVTGELVRQVRGQDRTFYATKVWTQGREKGIAQINESLRRLQTQRLDLLQIHNLVDWRTHLATLRKLKGDGVVRYMGVTHYTIDAHEEIQRVLTEDSFDFAQFNYSIATRAAEQRLLPFCQERGIAVLINRPFEEGALFTRVRGRKLPGYATELGCTSWAQVFLKFIVSHPAVTAVIPATSRVSHMQDNLQAAFGPIPDKALRERMAKDFDKAA